MEELLQGIIEALEDPELPDKMESLVLRVLHDRPLVEIAKILRVLSDATPHFAKALGTAAVKLRKLSTEELAMMLSVAPVLEASARSKAALQASANQVGKTLAQAHPVGKTITRKDGRKFTRTAKVAAARKLQGRYLGSLRLLKSADLRAAVQKVAKERGVAAAVRILEIVRARGEGAARRAVGWAPRAAKKPAAAKKPVKKSHGKKG